MARSTEGEARAHLGTDAFTVSDCIALAGLDGDGAYTSWIPAPVYAEWTRLRREGGYGHFPTRSDVVKSCLLHRLLSGRDPLPEAPPTSHAAPWYQLIEEGRAGPPVMASLHPEGTAVTGARPIANLNGALWALERVHETGPLGLSYVVSHRGAPGTWVLEPAQYENRALRGSGLAVGTRMFGDEVVAVSEGSWPTGEPCDLLTVRGWSLRRL